MKINSISFETASAIMDSLFEVYTNFVEYSPEAVSRGEDFARKAFEIFCESENIQLVEIPGAAEDCLEKG